MTGSEWSFREISLAIVSKEVGGGELAERRQGTVEIIQA